MTINPFNIADYEKEIHDRVTEQFKNSVVFNKVLKLLTGPSLSLQEVLRQLMQERSLDTAIGAQLDILGDIVGQPRLLVDADLKTFFGFRGDWHADSYGDLDIPNVGSVWWDGNESMTGNVLLEDDLYRLLIKAKIMKNINIATPEDIMRMANFVFSTSGSTVTEEGGAKYRLMIGRPLSRQEVGILRYVNRTLPYESKILPKPIGVGVKYGSFDYDHLFAFQGVPNAKGYGAIDYSHFYDGTFEYDGSVVPYTFFMRDEDGELIGGYWASLHEDL